MAQTPENKQKKTVDPAIVAKISEGWRYVNIPAKDMYDQPFDGFHFSGGHGRLDEKTGIMKDQRGQEVHGFELHLKPGRHLLAPEVADEVENRLAIWSASMVRMMNPKADQTSLQQATRRNMAIVANPEAME
jgi:hypothetical protein